MQKLHENLVYKKNYLLTSLGFFPTTHLIFFLSPPPLLSFTVYPASMTEVVQCMPHAHVFLKKAIHE